MKCLICNQSEIGPNTAPYGGYMCNSEHLQCGDCNVKLSARCSVCAALTSFVDMSFRKSAPVLEPLKELKPINDAKMADVSFSKDTSILECESLSSMQTSPVMSDKELIYGSDSGSIYNESSKVYKTVTTNALREYDFQNCAKTLEQVQNYLRSCNQATHCNVPEKCSHPDMCITCGCSILTGLKSKPMSTDVMWPIIHSYENGSCSAPINISMLKVVEEPHHKPCNNQPLVPIIENVIKQSASLSKSLSSDEPSVISVTEITKELKNCSISESDISNDSSGKTASKKSVDLVSNAFRAVYKPLPVEAQRSTIPKQGMLPQFQRISFGLLMSDEEIMARVHLIEMKVTPASDLTISRIPVKCPDSKCKQLLFVSDFSTHLMQDHVIMPMEYIKRFQYKNFTLNPHTAEKGVHRCEILFLIQDKITDLGSGKFKDYLPIVVMSTRISLSDVIDVPATEIGEGNIDFLLVWVMGMVPREFPVSFTLTMTSYRTPARILISGHVYCIQSRKTYKDIIRNGSPLLIPFKYIHNVSKGKRDIFNMQMTLD